MPHPVCIYKYTSKRKPQATGKHTLIFLFVLRNKCKIQSKTERKTHLSLQSP